MSGNDDLKSRFEIYLEAALNSIEVDGLPKPISRADQYLLALIAKMREMTGPVGPMPALVNDLTTGGDRRRADGRTGQNTQRFG